MLLQLDPDDLLFHHRLNLEHKCALPASRLRRGVQYGRDGRWLLE